MSLGFVEAPLESEPLAAKERNMLRPQDDDGMRACDNVRPRLPSVRTYWEGYRGGRGT